ncbi:MAG: threonylcarbamoyl-AMP synthase [Bacteroidetes bacterium HGW-Bacteroidetes-6]|jgi:L-threonylcarbamoyladenylate synthase|nr:MAG: threonylcarbamoyl-AMP synthase [Bacteroidetes bacterium HGW-Bacteroidetes-6]
MLDYKLDIEKSVEVLRKHGVILYPTDTIWGLGCDALQAKAVKKVFGIKQREESKSFIVLLENVSKLTYYIDDIPPVAFDLIEQVKTPLTIIYPKARNLASNLISSDGSVAIRIVRDPFCQQLIDAFSGPIISTSANVSGEPAPTVFPDISPQIVSKADYVVEYKQNVISNIRPSTIIRLTGDWEYDVVRS